MHVRSRSCAGRDSTILSLYYDVEDPQLEGDRRSVISTASSFRDSKSVSHLVIPEHVGATPPTRWETLQRWVRQNPRRASSLVTFIVLVPLLIAVIDVAVTNSAKAHSASFLGSSSPSSEPNSTTILSSKAPHSPTKPLVDDIPTPASTIMAKGTAAPVTPTAGLSKLDRSVCFPLGSSALPSTGKPPSVDRDSWWCDPSLMYGFLGFSYALEATDCNDPTNSAGQITADFAKMKAFGATLVRIYAPECRQVSVWENLVKAGLANNMGIIPMVWWGFTDEQDAWRTSQANLYTLFTTSPYASVAPYVVHSASFGSEPIGDQVDGGPYGHFISDLALFRKKLNSFGIPVGISEDWDRKQSGYEMNSTDGQSLGAVGKMVQANTDIVHAHVMPYYHPDETALVTDAVPYTDVYLSWLSKYVKQPIMITETMWSSTTDTGHSRGARMDQVGASAYATYWNAFSKNCAMFKKYRAGWFLHTFSDNFEGGFGLLGTDGVSKIKDFHPPTC